MQRRLLLLFSTLICQPALGAIYRCVDEAGGTVFTQFPCINAEEVIVRPLSVIESPPLTQSEQLNLRHIAANSSRRERASQNRAKQQRRKWKKDQADKSTACQQALAGIANLRARKRAGYSLAESSMLRNREADLRQRLSLNC